MKKIDMPQLQVILPKEIESQVFTTYLNIAKAAAEMATRNVIVNTRYLNKKQLCEYFQCAPRVIDEWMHDGLRCFSKGNSIMFDMRDVEEYLETIKN